MERLTHERKSGMKTGYWSPNKKQELVDRLAMYEDREDAKDTNVLGKWIPCSERLPELHRVDMESEGEYYMISDSVIITDGESVSISEYEIDDGDRRGWLAHDFEEIEDVIAWMPLPEPYKQNDEGDEE